MIERLSKAIGETLVGNQNSTDSNGVVQFNNLSFTLAGNVYIQATTNSLITCSRMITISPTTASQLIYITQPVAQTAGVSFTTQPVLILNDLDGNFIPGSGVTISFYVDSKCSTTPART